VMPSPTPGGEGTKIKILDMRKVPSMEPERLGKQDVIFTYMLGAEGPFTTTIPYEQIAGKPVAEQNRIVKQIILKEHEERLAWQGREL